jgi:hypothetical protein
MDIQTAVFGNREDITLKQLAVGDNHEKIGTGRRKTFVRLVGAKRFRLPNGDIERLSGYFDCW